MKRYLFILSILTISFMATANNATKDSLITALKSATSTEKKLETLTNLMDISRQQEQVDYAKQLYKEALEQDNDYYKEAALTEILRYYVNNDIKDSAQVYLTETERELKGKSRDFLLTYMKTIMDVRVVFYTEGEERMSLIEKYKIKLETEKNLSALDRISINYVLGMAYSNRVDPGNEETLHNTICSYFKNVIDLSTDIPLKYSYLFRLNSFNILSLYSLDPEQQTHYTLRYLNMQKEYAKTSEMEKRPFISKRHLLNAYSVLATSAKTLGKDIATSYFQQFLELNKKYPEDAAFSADYDRLFTILNYYKNLENYKKATEYSDSIIYYFRHANFKADLSEYVIETLKEKINFLDSIGDYKEAYNAYKEYVILLDSARLKNMENKIEDLEVQKRVDELVVEKKALELDLQKSRGQLYLFFSLFILALCTGVYVFFRLGKVKNLYKELQESNRLVIIASEKAQESERMKNAFIKNMCHEVRTPLNAINGFAELITSEDVSNEEKQEFSKIIYANCTNITSMMNDILVIAQLDSNDNTLPLEPTNINLLCLHEMEMLKKQHQKPNIEYKVEGNQKKDLVYTDPTHLNLIIAHLLNNANKFTEQGSIILAYQPDESGKMMCISVTDTGCGIPADKSEWVFERFTKNDDFIPGSGLGLYLCRLVAQRLNGTIILDTSYTDGARFILKLPINPYKTV